MTDREVLVALRGGPCNGKVISALQSETEVYMVATTVFGVRTHIYRVDIPDEEISEAVYERTFPGLLR